MGSPEIITCLWQNTAQTLPGTIRGARERRKHVALRFRDVLICQEVYLSAVEDCVKHGKKSRGSALYTNLNGKKAHESLPDHFPLHWTTQAAGTRCRKLCANRRGTFFFGAWCAPSPKMTIFLNASGGNIGSMAMCTDQIRISG